MNIRSILAFLIFTLFGVQSVTADYVIGYDETKSLIANMTMMSYDRAHGTQVEFIARNGRTYLLYPGNTVIVKGEWKLNRTKKPNVFDMCFRYPSNTFNPATGQKGGGWECQAAGFYLRDIAEVKEGDVLGLSKSSAAPFELQRRKTSLSRLMRQLK